MKKLSLFVAMIALFVACQEEPSLTERETSRTEPSFVEKESSITLLRNEAFNRAFRTSVNYLKGQRERLTENVDLSRLRASGGMLVVEGVEDFQPVYEQVEKADERWMETHRSEIMSLMEIAKKDKEVATLYGEGEELAYAIEDLLISEGIHYYDLQASISDRMPIRTLWAKARKESAEWLATQGQDADWSQDPDNQYAVHTMARLFLNEATAIQIAGEVKTFDFEASVVDTEKDSNLQGRGPGGCRTFWMTTEYTDNTGEPTCLRMRCYVNNFGIWRSFGVNAKGWIWAWGRWHEWGFWKSLVRDGNMILHRGGLVDNCDPVFAQEVTWRRVEWHVEYAINHTIWGLRNYAGACRQNFGGSVVGRNRIQWVRMN